MARAFVSVKAAIFLDIKCHTELSCGREWVASGERCAVCARRRRSAASSGIRNSDAASVNFRFRCPAGAGRADGKIAWEEEKPRKALEFRP